jgi:hypothetical protein
VLTNEYLESESSFCGAAEPQKQPGCFRAARLMTEVVAKKQRIPS